MSNAAYTPISKSEEHTEDSLPTYPASSEAHSESSDAATYPPPPQSAQGTTLPENLCFYTLDLPGAFNRQRTVICGRGASKEDIIDKLSSISPGVLSRTPIDKIIFETQAGGYWYEVMDSSFHDAIVKGRPSHVKISLRLTRLEWWQAYGLVATSPITIILMIVLLVKIL